MNVLMVSDVYFPRINGVSTSIATFRAQLERLGARSHLIAPAYASVLPQEEDIWRLPSRPVPFDPEDRIIRVKAIKALSGRLAGMAFDLVHVHTPFAAHYGGIALAQRLGLPIVATYHTFFEEYLHHYCRFLPRPLLKRLARSISRRQGGEVDALVVPSGIMKQRLDEYGVRTSMHVVPTGIPCAAFGAGDRHRFRHRYGITENRPVALYVGRAAHEKNIDFLLHCAAAVRQQVPNMALVVAGEGPARESLEALAGRLNLRANVVFVGNLDRATELNDCYAAADLFVFASRTETQGLVLIEAMASGLPVLAVNEMGAGEVLAGARSACRVAHDRNTFTSQWLRLIGQPEELAQLRRVAREDALAWDDALMAGRLLEVYRKVVEAHRQGAGRAQSGRQRPHPRDSAAR